MRIDLRDLNYLRDHATQPQIAARAYEAILKLPLHGDASVFSEETEWALAGSLPIGLFREGESDLDLIVAAPNPKQDAQSLEAELKARGIDTRFSWALVLGVKTALVQFHFDGFEFEVFVQQAPLALQNAIRHLLVEARLLELGGEPFRERVLKERAKGLKTEPAFLNAFNPVGLVAFESKTASLGDAYRFLLELEDASDHELKNLVTF